MTNVLKQTAVEENVAELFRVIGQPVRVQILLVIAQGEACVCHLEAYLGLRQAAISQHLMLLRDAGLVTTHRDGRNIYYRLARPEIMDLVRQASVILGISIQDLETRTSQPLVPCPCPRCNPDKAGDLDCSHIHVLSLR
jgi:DNA-binding transcriptional ArsR family regulator